MAYAESREMFSEVTLSVDVTTFKEPDRVTKILSAYSDLLTQVSPLFYEVKGSFEEIDNLFVRLSSPKLLHNSSLYHQHSGDSPVHHQGPRDSPLHSRGPRDSPVHHQGPRDSPLHSQGPRDSPVHHQGLRDSPLHPWGPRDSPVHHQGPRNSPLHPQGPRDSPVHHQGPRNSPLHPQGPRDSSVHHQGPRDSSVHPQGPRDSSIHHQGPRDSPVHPQHPQSPSISVKPVEVVRAIWDFIQQNCKKELDKIRGGDIDIQPVEKLTPKSPDKILVTFQSHGEDQIWAQFARERFVTFYQRLATDLQVMRESLDPQDIRKLQRAFPELLFSCGSGKREVAVTGRFASIVKLKDFLKNDGTTSPSFAVQSQQPINPRESLRTSSTSSSHNRPLAQLEEICPICLNTSEETDKITLKCEHSFCRGCLMQAFNTKPVCPTCGVVYGKLEGTQPTGGTMTIRKESSPLPGYENYGTITIKYHINNGIQTEEHPNPGQPYHGVSRTAYLPDSTEGRKVMMLLKRAFDQRLTFTIGMSSTTGMNNVVTWNDIHHKTSKYGGTSCYGYPDSDYLNRVQDELKLKGIY
ncbi:E3 ubiquitin-protein ligase DTX3L isoform X1 [Esox lucius]|uniref:E3 ubiquitin-protein ligase n=2 Tax=Esox lucius TaxID=8010 RepID=A0A3P9ALI0_ESOLU|nr:E3 ubiquitin-protein ligase DTX3L isoform X1 [Esox lucius]